MVARYAALRRAIAPDLRDWVANRLVSAHIRIVRTMVLGLCLNAALVVTALWDQVAHGFLLIFACYTIAAGCHRLWLAQVARGRRLKRLDRMIASFELNSLWLGLNLGVPLALLLPIVSPGGQVLLAICGIAQIALAAYMVRTLPRAATIYISAQALGLAIGLGQLGTPQAWTAVAILAAASGLLIQMAFVARDLFVTRILSDRELSASVQTVKLLLNEYEESGSDWLFELDGMDRLINVSPRFAQSLGLAVDRLEGMPLVFLFAGGRGRDDLAEALIARRPVRGEVLEVAADYAAEAQMWWSVSGRPAYAATNGAVGFRGVIADVSVQRLAESRAHHMAHYDALTGLPNRSRLTQTLSELLDRREDNAEVALLVIDVDRFKAVNDMYGHPTGDAFLRELAARLSATVAESGLGGMRHLVARLGGDEFAVVVSGEDSSAQAVRLAELLLAAIEAPLLVDGHEIAAGISIGIALAPEHAVLTQQLMSNADIALYAAKSAGRGGSAMFAPGMDEALHDRHTLGRDLRHAVPRGQLRLFLQPLVDVATEAMTGYEALLRWEHPERGQVQPDTFIPIAEETGLIVPIGEWVIRTALAEAAHWQGGEAIAINLSPIQLGSPNLLPTIVSALAESQLDPARVEFEITESVLLENSDANIEVLRRLHALGVKIALDDFGTGYSSLNYLLTFPFDKIKIDRRFISDLSTREESRAIVSAVIGLANELGMCTVAEGVEEGDQLDRLREQGCVMVQGWLFGRALPSEDYHPRLVPPVAEPPVSLPKRAASLRKSPESPRRKQA